MISKLRPHKYVEDHLVNAMIDKIDEIIDTINNRSDLNNAQMIAGFEYIRTWMNNQGITIKLSSGLELQPSVYAFEMLHAGFGTLEIPQLNVQDELIPKASLGALYYPGIKATLKQIHGSNLAEIYCEDYFDDKSIRVSYTLKSIPGNVNNILFKSEKDVLDWNAKMEQLYQ